MNISYSKALIVFARAEKVKAELRAAIAQTNNYTQKLKLQNALAELSLSTAKLLAKLQNLTNQ